MIWYTIYLHVVVSIDLWYIYIYIYIFYLAHAGSWMYIGYGCVGARDNKFKEITYRRTSRFVGAIKLVRRNGHIGCHGGSWTYWGCHVHGLNMLVTDPDNKILYPSPRLVTFRTGGWYKLPGYTPFSPELVFSDFGYPKYLKKGDKLRIWYAEDLYGYTEGDNHGSTCMYIYAYSM